MKIQGHRSLLIDSIVMVAVAIAVVMPWSQEHGTVFFEPNTPPPRLSRRIR